MLVEMFLILLQLFLMPHELQKVAYLTQLCSCKDHPNMVHTFFGGLKPKMNSDLPLNRFGQGEHDCILLDSVYQLVNT